MKVVLENLTKIFPARGKKGGQDVVAVNDFTFEIPDGKLIGLLGPSGCGKSTTLYMICGLQKPSGGKIYFGDDDVTDLAPENRGVGLVFQNYALYPHMTVKQNIMFPLQNLKGADKLTKEEMLERTVQAAALVQIDNLLDRKPSELSGGQQQRVAIARALVKMPRVLLLDEPLSNLDARLRLQTREEIRRIQRETGITTVFVTHDQEEAMSISDMIVVMKLGVVQQIGAPQEVYDNPANLFVAKFLGTPPINVFSGYVLDGKLYVGGEADPITETEEYEETITLEPTEKGAEPETRVVTKTREKIVGYNFHDGEAIMDVPGVDNRAVYIGIRPEGFEIAADGVLCCDVVGVDVMGRDVSIVSKHTAAEVPVVRSIVNADYRLAEGTTQVRYNLKRHKVFIFDKETEERVYFEVK